MGSVVYVVKTVDSWVRLGDDNNANSWIYEVTMTDGVVAQMPALFGTPTQYAQAVIFCNVDDFFFCNMLDKSSFAHVYPNSYFQENDTLRLVY